MSDQGQGNSAEHRQDEWKSDPNDSRVRMIGDLRPGGEKAPGDPPPMNDEMRAAKEKYDRENQGKNQ